MLFYTNETIRSALIDKSQTMEYPDVGPWHLDTGNIGFILIGAATNWWETEDTRSGLGDELVSRSVIGWNILILGSDWLKRELRLPLNKVIATN